MLHRGYLQFFDALRERDVSTLYLVGDELLETHEEFDYLNRKDRIRAIPQDQMQCMVESVSAIRVHILNEETAQELKKSQISIVTPDEDVGKVLKKKYFVGQDVEFVDVFLRFDRERVAKDKDPDADTISPEDFQKKIFEHVLAESHKSTDVWRQIGGALVKDDQIVFTLHNEHMPDPQTPYVFGDARSLFKKGINVNYVTTAHVEGALIAQAAKHGITTEGADLYITDFPCPYCARIVAKSGVKRIFFLRGYAVLEGDEVLRDAGIKVIRVKI